MIEIDDFMENFDAEDSLFKKYNEWSFTMNPTQKYPLYASSQDPTVTCFTYNTKYNNFVSLPQIEVKLNITKFQHLFGGSGDLYILAHYPGQLIRNIRRYVMKIRRKYWNQIKSKNNNNYVMISISGLTVMRFRENDVDPCDPTLIDDDAGWKKHATKAVGCIPPYWKNKTL